jgi:hypothetical protein
MREYAIRCPATSLPVGTGEFAADRNPKPTEIKKLLTTCPECRGRHEWRTIDAWLIEAVSEKAAPDDDDTLLI